MTAETVETESVRDLCRVAARAAWSKGGEGAVILGVAEAVSITDAFVIVSGSNSRQVRTIAEEVELQIKRAAGRGPRSTEGLDDARWVLMDYGDFVVHVFHAEAREFYQLDQLWGDADRWAWEPDEALIRAD